MPAEDDYRAYQDSLITPPENAVSVTPDDDTDLTNVSRAIYIGAAGNLLVTMLKGNDVSFLNVPSGTLLPIRVSRIKATGTTASGIVSVW